jgi:branched-chain amino acid aminotransferase
MAFFSHFWAMNLVNCNGKLVPENEPVFAASNRGFKYGDGVFETLKVVMGKILLADLHFERLFTSLQLLQMQGVEKFNKNFLETRILDLCRLNNCELLARVRLAIYREDESEPGFLMQAFEINDAVNKWNENGWKLGVYPLAQKSCDAFANIKSANYLPYVLAGLYAKENGWEESMVLNSDHKIADGSKTNLFLIKEGALFTPALNQGCVNGVMRRFIIEESKKNNFTVHQTEVSVDMLLEADELFVTNAIEGIRWIASFQDKAYTNAAGKKLYDLLLNKY